MQFSNLGKHCSDCKKLDFLPFYCNECKKYYCSSHRTHHECVCNRPITNKTATTTSPPDKKIKMKKCCFCKKRFMNYLIIKCNNCNKNYCVKHRYLDTHNCKKSKHVLKKYKKMKILRSCKVN